MPRRLPTPSEHRRFQTDAVDTMRDTCVVLRFTAGAQDAHGMPQDTYVRGTPTPCGYRLRTRRETLGGAQVPVEIASLRLPLTVVVGTLDRIQLTHRIGRALTPPLVFEITDLRPGVAQWLLDLTQAADPQRGLAHG